jgi:hypothetical protein
MIATYAPDPVGTVSVSVPDFRSRSQLGDTSNAATGRTTVSSTNAPAPAPGEPQVFSTPDMHDALPPLPLEQSPPGTAFAAAVLSGALPPRPQTAQEVFMRLGSAGWSPPDSDFRLADRTV